MKLISLQCERYLKLYCHQVFSHATPPLLKSLRFVCTGRSNAHLLGGIGLRVIMIRTGFISKTNALEI